MPNEVDVADKLKMLLDKYRSQLPQRLSEIEILWNSACKQDSEGSTSKELYRVVHSLAGSGASFGFVELSKAAKAFELKIKPYCEGDVLFTQDVQNDVEDARILLLTVLKQLST